MANEFEIHHVNCLITDGGLGDLVAALVAVDYVHKTYKHAKLRVWVPDYAFGLTSLALPGVKVKNFSAAKKEYNSKLPAINTRWNGRTSPMKRHLVDYAFECLCDEAVSIDKKNYLKINTSKVKIDYFDLPEKYVVMTTGFTAPNREFLPQYINEVVAYIKSKGYSVVFLGKTQTATGTKHTIKGNFSNEIQYNEGFNFIDHTSILEAMKIMGQAKAVVGLDNGLLHVAACTDVAIVGGFTNCDPKTRMPYRNNELGWNFYPVVPPKDLSCRFCQTRLNFVYGHDFKECYYKNMKCLELLEPKLYIEQLEKIL